MCEPRDNLRLAAVRLSAMLSTLPMNIRMITLTACLALNASSFAAPPKPKKAPPKNVAPSLTVKDLALREARTCDTNHNGKIDASEMSAVRAAQAKNPKSYLYLFDDNSNKHLDDSELSKIRFSPAPPNPFVLHRSQPKKKK